MSLALYSPLDGLYRDSVPEAKIRNALSVCKPIITQKGGEYTGYELVELEHHGEMKTVVKANYEMGSGQTYRRVIAIYPPKTEEDAYRQFEEIESQQGLPKHYEEVHSQANGVKRITRIYSKEAVA